MLRAGRATCTQAHSAQRSPKIATPGVRKHHTSRAVPLSAGPCCHSPAASALCMRHMCAQLRPKSHLSLLQVLNVHTGDGCRAAATHRWRRMCDMWRGSTPAHTPRVCARGTGGDRARTVWCLFRRSSRCARSRSSGTASAHTTATSVPMAIITLVWYTGAPAGSVVWNVTSSCARTAPDGSQPSVQGTNCANLCVQNQGNGQDSLQGGTDSVPGTVSATAPRHKETMSAVVYLLASTCGLQPGFRLGALLKLVHIPSSMNISQGFRVHHTL